MSQKGGKQRCSVLSNLSDLEITDRHRDRQRRTETEGDSDIDTETKRDIQIERKSILNPEGARKVGSKVHAQYFQTSVNWKL